MGRSCTLWTQEKNRLALSRRAVQLRQQYRLSIGKFAAMVGVPDTAWRRVEEATFLPSVGTLLLLHEKTNVSLDWLILGQPPMCRVDGEDAS